MTAVAGVAASRSSAWRWTLRGDDDDDTAAEFGGRRRAGTSSLISTVAGTFVLAELGDKTMLATFALAANQGALATWIGSTGEVAANLVAIVDRPAGRPPAIAAAGPNRLGASLRSLAGVVVGLVEAWYMVTLTRRAWIVLNPLECALHLDS